MKKYFKAFFLLTTAMLFVSSSAYAETNIYKTLETPFYDPNSTASTCSAAAGSTSSTGSATNLDYAGMPILNQGMLQALSQNEPTYQQAAQQIGIPWQVLAAIHYRESSFSLDASHAGPNGQFQITSQNYPYTGTLTQQQFLQEAIDAANFVKNKVADLNANPSVATIKNAFYLYNGTGGTTYSQQAANLGFDSNTQAYEGSPYVMNMADAKRDPNIPNVVSSGEWNQYATPTTIRPASTAQYGAYVVYASLAGITLSGGDCSTGSVNCSGSTATTATGANQVRQNVACIAKQELALWNSDTLKPGTDFYKYSENRPDLWCADFVSWVYNQAGYPLGPLGSPTNNWNISYVGNLLIPPQNGSKFVYHASVGYTPQPGDIALHYSTQYSPAYYHTNIVISANSGQILLIGGDQHPSSGGGSAETNVVSTETINSAADDNIIGYVGPN